jgi:hypothetical protein
MEHSVLAVHDATHFITATWIGIDALAMGRAVSSTRGSFVDRVTRRDQKMSEHPQADSPDEEESNSNGSSFGSIDRRTGPAVRADGGPPPRTEDLSTRSYRSLPDEELWHQIASIKPVALVGLKSPDMTRGAFRGQTLIPENETRRAIHTVQTIPRLRRINTEGPDDSEITPMPLMADGVRYPAICVEIADVGALSALRSLEYVDYVEPLYFFDGIGCALPTYGGNAADENFSPNPAQQQPDRVSWNFRHMGIQDAWRLFNDGHGVIVAPGRGVPIGVIDTGVYPDQPQLNELFPLPPGTRSPAEQLSARPDSTVYCSHGTRIAGLATAPADGTQSTSANYVGIAWGSDLISVKVGNGVVQTDTTVVSVVAGLDMAIERGARVLTLAFGMPYASSFLRDNIERIFDTRPNVLLIAAAGTNIPWVTFPASMDREVVAVTIVEFRATSSARYQKYAGPLYFPDIVAYGPSVDFAAVNGPGDIPTTGNTATPVTTIGGSSAGTAMIAGIAALAWARIPQLTRAELISRLAAASSLAGIDGQQGVIGRSPEVGFGIPDAYVAAGGARRVSIEGPQSVTPGSSYTLTASTDGYVSFFRYQWDTGESTRSITANASGLGSRTHTVTITNLLDGSSLSTSLTVVFSGAHLRRIYSAEMVSEWATFFDGKRVDRPVNTGKALPAGCSVMSVLGLEYVSQNGNLVPRGVPVSSKDNGNNGFSILRPGGLNARALDAVAHVWHDGFSAIRVRVVYEVWEADGVDCVEPGITMASP